MARLTRSQAVRKAHRMGLSLRGFGYYSQGGERDLAERTSSGIRKQAVRELGAAYKPAIASIDRRESQIKSLDAKRQADLAAYQTWLGQKQAEIQAAAQGRREQLNTLADTQTHELRDSLDRVRTESAARQAAVGGAVAPNTAAADAARQAIISQDTGARQAIEARQRLGIDLASATSQNNLAYIGSLHAQRQADLLKSLADVADERDKALLQQGADVNKRIADLLANEGTKAQARIAAGQFDTKLRLDAQKFAATRRDKAAARGVTVRGQDLAHADRAASNARQNKKNDRDFLAKYGVTAEQFQSYSAAHRKRIIAQAGGGSGGPRNTQKQLQDNRIKLSTAQGWAVSGFTDKDGKVHEPPLGLHWTKLSNWLQTQAKVPKAYADLAAWSAWVKNEQAAGHWPPDRATTPPERLRKALKLVSGIRG